MWDELQCGPLSESGEGINLDGGGITVVAVLADEALEAEVGKDPGAESCTPSRGISCCGCAPPDDGSEEDVGGEGSRAALSAAEERDGFGCCCRALLSDAASSQERRLGIWVCVAEGLRGLAAAVGRRVWWAWASRSRDRLTDRLW
jgi:hypothetical protein